VSLQIRLLLVETDPKNLVWRYELGATHAHIGEVLSVQGDFVVGINAERSVSRTKNSIS
jgi:hypothetical protein